MIQSLVKYFLEKPKTSQTMKDVLSSQEAEVGLVLSERIINIPADVAAPSYGMLTEEIQWASDDVAQAMSTANGLERALPIYALFDCFENLFTVGGW